MNAKQLKEKAGNMWAELDTEKRQIVGNLDDECEIEFGSMEYIRRVEDLLRLAKHANTCLFVMQFKGEDDA